MTKHTAHTYVGYARLSHGIQTSLLSSYTVTDLWSGPPPQLCSCTGQSMLA